MDPSIAHQGFEDPRAILRRHAIQPRKSLGQHFLVDQSALARIIAAIEASKEDTVLEIGAGLGLLSRALAAAAGRVVALEIDEQLHRALSATLAECPNVRIVLGDVLAMDLAEAAGLPPEPPGRRRCFKVVGNLPYYITSLLLRQVLTARVRPELAVVTVQEEVARRILAGPGAMSLLAVSVQFYAQPRLIARIPAGAFYPSPKVDSAVLRLEVRAAPPVALPSGGEEAFFRVVKAGFGQRRKQLRNSLAAGLRVTSKTAVAALAEAGIDPRRRPETLDLEEWSRLATALDRMKDGAE